MSSGAFLFSDFSVSILYNSFFIFSVLFSVKMSNLVASQIMTHTDVGSRASSIEKWVAVADICRCLNNYNGVLEITSALNRSAIYRLKKTWAKISKQVSSFSLYLKSKNDAESITQAVSKCCVSTQIYIVYLCRDYKKKVHLSW